MAPAIVNRYLHTLSKVLHLAVISGVIDSNPLARVGKLKEPPPRGVWLSGEEEDRLMPELEKDGAHMVAFAELPLHVGFRAGEPLSRRYGHVSFEDTSVLIVKTKTGRDRRVPLNSRALAILKDLRQGAGDDDLNLRSC